MPSVSMSERVSQLSVFLKNNGSNKFSLVMAGWGYNWWVKMAAVDSSDRVPVAGRVLRRNPTARESAADRDSSVAILPAAIHFSSPVND